MDDERYIVLPFNEKAAKPLIGVRGVVDWVYPITDLLPSTWYKVRMTFRAEEVGIEVMTQDMWCAY